MKNNKKTLKEELYGKDYKRIGDYPIQTFDGTDWVAIAIAIFAVIVFITLIGSI